ncbi:uncharacterized protein LOC128550707 [Mercenaria mercenaria]|uniref:uncharacterized protein LOC128550707 n=1 Tax=Mercenaria mercenaria TaxID=6596 RepID=UPI00234F3917|nr:uncharacterized protein LOC128550707 [Mercenaria mercenaria]XP_053386257.1 uncharacterized protein LOC128550707 [Mercenaria mercenaria]XP_053386258.1 uncharacterized protein LOC128550707 [Mercenaria mercenaria]
MGKRKLGEVENGYSSSSSQEENDDVDSCASSASTNSSTDVPTGSKSKRKKTKSVKFKGVNVFYFPRTQGFTCVPSEGGSTLGMGEKHVHRDDFTLAEFAREQRRIHREMLEKQRQEGKLMEGLEARLAEMDEEEEGCHSDDDSDWEFEDLDDYYFLQPVSIRQRRIMLRNNGVKKIDNTEKDTCKHIRQSREQCGCDCKLYCDPKTCACSLAGIKCQVDRLSFPCGCTKDGCANPTGRVEFNPIRVRTHFIHTVMRLEFESKCEKSCKSSDSESEDKDAVNLSQFNSNERGSCRDCQNSEFSNALMQEMEYAALNREQSHMTNYNMTNSFTHVTNGQNGNMNGIFKPNQSSVSYVNLNNSTLNNMYNSATEFYNAENTTSMYDFQTHKEDTSSYSEMSESSNEDGAMYRKSFGNLSRFQQNINCTVSSSSFPVSSNSNEKFSDIAEASEPAFKLQPISSILNSVNDTFSTHSSTLWNSDGKLSENSLSSSLPAVSTASLPDCCYTTMNNTTSDKIAETCPGISSHMNKEVNNCDIGGLVNSASESDNLSVSSFYDSDSSNHAITPACYDVDTNENEKKLRETIEVTAHKVCEDTAGPNFGEIIKESIFEIVSA